MPLSSVQEYAGLLSSLDRLEKRIKAYRAILLDISMGREVTATMEEHGISTGELETVEALVERYATRITGSKPNKEEWEKLQPYCSRNEDKKKKWADQNYEYFRWALLWIQKTRMYLEYLEGVQSAAGAVERTTAAQDDKTPNPITEYDIALSFAGEDRIHARQIASLLSSKGLSIFYDEYEQVMLWGRNLYTHLSDVYQNRAKFCLILISESYAKKLWTKREREAAQARAFSESREYILPLRLDDTSIPGIEETVGYIDIREHTHEEVAEMIAEKVKRSTT